MDWQACKEEGFAQGTGCVRACVDVLVPVPVPVLVLVLVPVPVPVPFCA